MKTTALKPQTELVAALQDVRKEFSQVGTALFYLADALEFMTDKHGSDGDGEASPLYLFAHVASTERDRHDAAQTRSDELLEQLNKVGLAASAEVQTPALSPAALSKN